MMRIRTRSGSIAALDDRTIGELRATLTGELLAQGMDGYDAARRIFNGLFDRRPALIVRCRTVEDVQRALRFAGARDLLFSVRGGGHSIAGHSMCDDGVTIDLSLLRKVAVDAPGRLARVAGGATWADVDRETQRFGLATPGGVVSHTGVAGLTLNGGVGWLRNRHGLSCDNLRRVEMVTAQGEVLNASAAEHPELFWALRGGGGNFGVATAFEFELHPVGPQVAASFPMYALADADEVLRRWIDWLRSVPDEISSELVLWTMPVADALPAGARGRDVIIPSGVHAGDAVSGLEQLEPLRKFGRVLGEIHGVLSYCDVQSAFDASFPPTGELCCYWKSLYANELTGPLCATLLDLARNRSVSNTMIVVQHMAGVARVATAGAYQARGAPFLINVMGNWRERGESAGHIAWVREAWRRLTVHATSTVYLNYLGDEPERDSALVRGAFGANYERLVDIKTKFDPRNLFQMNQNIRPREISGSSA